MAKKWQEIWFRELRLAFDQLSDGHHNALLPSGQKPEYFDIDVDFLMEGTNVIAVQVHNQSSTSSDMTALPVLIIGHQYY